MATYEKVKNVVLGVTAVTAVVASAYAATNLYNKERDYSDILVESAKKYVENNNLAIESQLVTSASRLKESGNLVGDLKDDCINESYVTVTNEDGTYKYEPSLVCKTEEGTNNSTIAANKELTYTVKTSSTTLTNANVEVQVIFSEEIHNVSVQGWTLSSDKKVLTKIFTENSTDEFQAVSLDGYRSVNVKVSASNIDKEAPVVLIDDKEVVAMYAAGVKLNVDDANLSSVKVNGEEVTNYSISSDGNYEVVATDVAGNKTVKTFSLGREAANPPKINNITDGKVYTENNLPLRVTFSGSEATLYGPGTEEKTFISGGFIRQAGKYALTVKNSVGESLTVNFTIDDDVPEVWAEADGNTLQNGKSTNKNVKVYFSDKYTNVTVKSSSKYNNLKYGEEFTKEGSYVITATDEAGHTKEFRFTIDRSIPVVNGVIDGKYYSSNRTIVFDNKGGTVTAKLDNKEISSGHTVTDEGKHTLVVSSTAGNSNVINFWIDKTKPEFEGFSTTQDTVITKNNFEVKASDTNLQSVQVKKGDEVVATSETTLKDEGVYTLIATDKAGNTTTKTVKIDKTAPAVTVGGNAPIIGVGAIDKAFEGDVTFTVSDMSSTTVKVDGKAFTGNTVTANGRHSLEVTDAVGNKSIIYFTIAKDVPEVKLISNGNEIIADNEMLTHYFNKDVTIKISNNVEIKSAILTTPDGDVTLTASEIANGKTINANYGFHKEYKLVVIDSAERNITVNFVIDRKRPTSSVVSEVYSTDKLIEFSDMSGIVSATLDGKAIESGKVTLSEEGEHTLVLTDKAGNSVSYSPIIDKSAPKVTIDGKLFTASELTNTIYFNKEVTVSLEDTYSSINVSVNGETRKVSVTSPKRYTEILSANGEYAFIVTDGVGHTARFTVVINTKKPVGAITKENVYDETIENRINAVKMTLTLDENYTISDSNKLNWEPVEPSAVAGKVQYTYTLTETLSGAVTLTNNVGNSINVPYDVVIDKTAPTASIEYSTTAPISGNVKIYMYTNEPVKFTDSLAWSEGQLITEGKHKGEYKYVAIAVENVEKILELFDGNQNKTPIKYSVKNIDKNVDLIGYKNEEDETIEYFTYSNNGAATNQPVTVTLKAYEELTFEDTVLTWTESGPTKDENGKDVYTYTATAAKNCFNTLTITDHLNNEKEVTYKVTGIDTEGPKVGGFDEDKYDETTDSYLFNTNVTPTFTEGTAVLKKKNAKGEYVTYIEKFTSGTEIGGTELIDETYRLEVTDGINTTTIDFRIDKVIPTATYTLSKTESNKTIATITASEYITVTANATEVIYLDGHEGFTYTFNDPEVITFRFKDEAGNVGSIDVDAIAPEIEGIENNGKYATTDKVITITDNKLGVSATLDGTAITGTEVENGFSFNISSILGTTGNGETHTLVVRDVAGNIITYTFTIDTESPIITGIENEGLYNNTVNPRFTEGTATLERKYTELVSGELVEKTETIDNFESGANVSADGKYTLTVTDGITTPTVYTFEIDKTAPTIISSGIETSNGKAYTNEYVIVTLNASEPIDMTSTHELIEVSADKKTYKFKVSANGEVTFSFKDKANNTGNKTVNVQQIDKTPPTISGVTDKELYNVDEVPLTITFFDENGDETVTLTRKFVINGEENTETINNFVSGNKISDEGFYTLEVTDIAGNGTTYTFEVDKTAPDVTLPTGGTTVGGKLLYNKDVKPLYSEGIGVLKKKVVDDQGVESYVDVTTYDKEVAISENGEYRLIVSDLAGNKTIKEFIIDKATPNVKSIKADITAPTNENVTLTITLDKPVTMVTSYSTVSADRKTYTVTVTENKTVSFQFHDDAGNANNATFTVNNIDRKMKHGEITADEAPTKGPVTLTLTVDEPIKNIDTTLWTKVETTVESSSNENLTNSTPVPDQTPVSYTRVVKANGEYTVTYTDMAGNEGSASITINNIDTGAPTFEIVDSVSLPEYSDIYKDTVKVKVKDQNLKAITYTLNGEEQEPVDLKDYANGEITVSFSKDGVYVINAIDDFDQPAQPITFTVDKEIPTIIVKANGNICPGGIVYGTAIVEVTDTTLNSVSYIETIGSNSTTKTVKVVNGKGTISLGAEGETEATYEIIATDKANHTNRMSFGIDTKKPEINGFENNKKYKDSVTVNVIDANLKEVTYTGPTESQSGTLEGEHTFEEAGTYTIVAKDYANNTATKTFTIDKTTPKLLSIKSKYMADGQKYTNMANDILILTFNKPVKLDTTSSSWVDENGVTLTEEARQKYSDTLYFAISVNFTLSTTFSDEVDNTEDILYEIKQFYRETPVINVGDVIIVNKKNVNTFELPEVTGSTTNSEIHVTVTTEDTFDPDQLEQVITYNATDDAGNTASKDVTVRIIDTRALDTIKLELSELRESDYTEDSWTNKNKLITDLESAIAGTNENVDLKDVTQSFVDSKITEIRNYNLVAKGLNTDEFEDLQDIVGDLVKSDYVPSDEFETLWSEIDNLAKTDTSTIEQLQSNLDAIVTNLIAKLTELEGKAAPIVKKNQEYIDSFKDGDYSNKETFISKLGELNGKVDNKTIKLQSKYNKEVETLEAILIKNPVIDTDLVKAESDFAKLVLTDYTTTSYNRLKAALEAARESVTNPGLISVYTEKMTSVISAQKALEIIPRLMEEPTLTTSNTNSDYAKLGDSLTLEFESNVELNLELSETNRFATVVTINGKTAAISKKENTAPGKYVYVATVTVEDTDQERYAPYTIVLASKQQITGTTVGKTSNIFVDRTAAEATLTAKPSGQTKGPVTLTLSSSEEIIITRTAKKVYSDDNKVTITDTNEKWTPVGTEGKEYTLDITENRIVVVYYTDKAGNIASEEIEITNIDTAAPTIEIDANYKTATKEDVVLTIVASEPLKSMIIDGTLVTGTDNTYTYTVTEPKIVTIQFEDYAGYEITENYDATYIDKTPATIEKPIYEINGNSTKITVTSSEKITFKDQVTLVDENGLEWEETPVGDGTYKYVATTDKSCKATFTVYDHVFHESTFSYDVTKPELLSIKSKVMNYYNLLEGIKYTNAKADILILEFNKPVKLNTSSPSWVKDESGTKLSAEERQQYSDTLYFAINVNFGFNTTFTDELGRTGRISYKIEQFDRQAPQFTSDIDTLYGQNIALTVDFSDVDVATDGTVTNNDHEVTAKLLKENGDVIATIGKATTIKYKKDGMTAAENEVLLEESGIYTIRLTDEAGNETEKKFELDVDGPTIEIAPNSTKDDGTYIGPVNITVTDKNGLGDDVHIEVEGKEEHIILENGKGTITDGGTYKVVAYDSLGNRTVTQEFTVAEPPKIVSIRSTVMNCELLEGQQYTNAKRDTLILTFNRPVVLKTQSASLVDEDGNKLEDRTTPRETYYFQININFDLSINLEDTDGQTGRLYYKIRQFDRGEPKFTSEIKSLYGKGINLPVTFTDEDLSTDYLNDKIVSDDNHTITAELLDEDEKVITTIKNGDVIKYKAEADTEAQEGEILVTAGKYTIKLTDKAGNTASKEFEVVDNGPEITLPESVVTGKKIYDSAITPEYEGTGVLEKKINGEYTEVTYTKGTPIPSGEYKLTVTDKVGNSNFETFKIYAEVPTFETFDARKVTVKGTPLTITDPTATDALGNTLTPVITDVTYNGTSLGADGTVDYSEAGTYVITYTATDEALNPETATMTIEVLDIDAFNSIKTAMDDLEGNMKDAEGNVIPFYERVKVNKDDYTEASWNARMAKIAEVNAELAKDEITIDQAYIETIVALLNNTAEDNAGEAYKLVSNGVSFTAYDNLVTEFNGLNGVDYDKTKIQGIIDKFDKESVSADELQSTFNRETYLPLKTKVESLKNNPKEITLISEDEKAAIRASVDYSAEGKETFFQGLDTLATQVADKTIKLQSEYNTKVSELKAALKNSPAYITDEMIEELTAIENKYQGKEADYTSGTFQTLQTAIANAKELLPNGKVSDFNTALDNIELAEQGLVKVLTATDVKINGESVTELVTRYAKSGDTLTLTFNTNHDINTASSIVTIDGVTANLSGSNKSYTATVTISDEVVADHKAEYTIVLVAEKAERKEYSNVQTNIIVDKTAPRKLDLTYTTGTVVTTDNGDKYVKNEATLLEGYKTNKNVIVKIKTNEELSAITDDGHNWFEIMAEPEIDLDDVESYYYRLEISENTNGPVSIKLKDMAGNESEVITYSVDGIDRSIPTATITPSTTELTNQDIVLTLTPSEELKTISEGWTKQDDGTYKMTVSTVGTYTATFIDIAGNPGSASIPVNNIDKIKPNVSVSYGAYTGGWSKNDVTVTITSDKQLAVLTDGESDWTTSEKGTEDAEGNITAPYTYSKTFSSYAGGETSLTIEDKAGNEPKEKVKFSIDGIDKNPPSLKVNANGNLYPGGLIHGRVTVTAEDDHLKSLTYIETIDGVSTTKYVTVTNGVASIELGTDDETEARYEFTATDEATNSTSFAFAVDTKKPVITGVTNGETYENSVTATVTDANIKEVTYTGPESGTFEGTTHEFTVDGTYTVTATDYANNTTTVEFTIDQTLPEVTGVEDGEKYNSIPTITFDKGTATLNGTPFTSGSTVGEGKNQTLVVTSPAGTTTITFTVDTVVPNITSIKDGKVYKGSVAINYDDATTIPTGMIGDKLVANGSTFSEEGTHTLVVTDETENKAEVTFTIDNTAPILEITDNKGVKHTGDFEVTLEADKVNKFTNFEYTASDRDGVTVNVAITGTVELSKKGDYTLVYTATDDVGNAKPITVTVYVKDTTAPVITMGEDGKAIEVKYGSTFTDPYGATAEDAFDGPVGVDATNNVNIYQVGTYKITYTATDAEGNKSSKERTVKVVSTDTGALFRTANQCREGTQCYGSYASNNYVWYSGHLWRVIKVNPDNTLKLVAEDAASGFSFDDNSSVFVGSNAEKWLNNVFYPSLNNGDTIVTEGEFCNEKMTSLTNIRYTCSAGSVVKSKVGLLTIDEYNILGGQNGFLNNGLQYFTMTPTSEDTTWVVEDDGTKERGYYVTEPYAMRPVININAVTVLSGRGTETDPFVIDEGNKSSAGSKLTSSTSGEYVNFGGKKWRVVSSSNEGTKLITDDYVKLGSDYEGQAFGTAGVFNTSSGIGYYLNNTIYNGFTTTEKSLIKLSRWYNNQYTFGQNPMDTTLVAGSKYTDAYVGLIRVGELMSGSTTSTVKVDRFTYWTLNYSGTNSWFVSWGGTSEISSATNLRGIRPVITLAEDVVIASGDGTEAHPYELDINKN